MVCPKCRFDNPQSFAFCGHCGASLDLTDRIHEAKDGELGRAERRQLTVMFCDLVGSTALSAQLDPEELSDVTRHYQSLCAEVIARHGGHIAQYLGDGVLAYFGYPISHEDDAQRAVYAGLEIVAAVASARERIERALRVRVGVHSGLAVVGHLGGKINPDPMAISGETPNIAARLQGIATPDSVVVSAATCRLIEGFFRCRRLGTPVLKGVASPIEVFEVLEPTGIHTRFERAVASGLTAFVGREQEIELLVERWYQAREGSGQVVIVRGEAGIGKSRLAQMLAERLANSAAVELACRCSPYYQNSALYPVTELLQHMLRYTRSDDAGARLAKLEAALARSGFSPPEIVPLFAALLSLPANDRYPALPLTPQRQKQKTFEAIIEWLRRIAQRRPTRLIVEDLHWADPSTLELLELLIEQVAAAPIMLILVFRPEFAPPWGSRPNLTDLNLGRLPSTATELMIQAVGGGRLLPAELTREIITKTEGVPLFVEELTQMVLESGLVKQQDGRYVLTAALPSLTIPSTLYGSLMARLDRLGPAKDLAQLAATIGKEFSYELLRAVWPQEEATLTWALGRLIDAELLNQQRSTSQLYYSFKHALIRDAAYESLLISKRREYHAQIATVLRERFLEIADSRPELLASHYTNANLVELAISWWQKAGQRALARSANREAIRHLSNGLELLARLPESTERDRKELDFLNDYGVTLFVLKGWYIPEAGDVYRRAQELCRKLGETHQLMTVLFGLAAFHLCRAELAVCESCVTEMMSIGSSSPSEKAVMVSWTAGATKFFMGEFTEAHQNLEQAIRHYDRRRHKGISFLVGQDLCAGSLMYDAMVLLILGFPDRAEQRFEESLSLARELGYPFTLAYCLVMAAKYCCIRRDFDRLPGLIEAARTVAREQGFSFWEEGVTAYELIGLALQGKSEELKISFQRAKKYSEIGYELAGTWMRANMAEGFAILGRYNAANRSLTEAVEMLNRNGERYAESEIARIRGVLALRQIEGRECGAGELHAARAAAEQEFREAQKIAHRQGAKLYELRAATHLGRLLTRMDRRDEGRRILCEIYDTITEGFDAPDLRDLKRALQEAA
ncbi:MAG: AAA family ATPase [Deltaproteobacteria bacterium]|nr:AAA family ATPase [Deltaproteobacteria bacterium]